MLSKAKMHLLPLPEPPLCLLVALRKDLLEGFAPLI